MPRYAAVEGHSSLVRDLETGAVININKSEIQQAKERKRARKKKEQEAQKLVEDVKSLKDELQEMRNVLNQIVEKL